MLNIQKTTVKFRTEISTLNSNIWIYRELEERIMKAKILQTARSRNQAKSKAVKKEAQSPETIGAAGFPGMGEIKPTVEIVSCISFQKFRYRGEKRPGKKYQEKDFMDLKLCGLADKVVRIVIICTDADNKELIHPNGLVGKDCHVGIYDKEYAITKQDNLIKIPYLRTERIKTKKKEHEKIQSVLEERALHLPTPYKERCLSQCTDKYTASRKFDTTKVCLGVIVTVVSHQGKFNGSLHAISHVVRNASEKTALAILKLSGNAISSSTGGLIDIFTTEDGPAIEHEKYEVYVRYDGTLGTWTSDKTRPQKQDILYNRVITYKIPHFELCPFLPNPEEAFIHIDCPQSNQFCKCAFYYITTDDMKMIIEPEPPKRKLHDSGGTIDIPSKKMRMQEDNFDNERSSDQIKANLKSKLIRNRSDFINNGNAVEVIHYESNFGTYNAAQQHDDGETGESVVLLDMDSQKFEELKSPHPDPSTDQNSSYQSIVELSPKTSGSIMGNVTALGNRASFHSDVEVVATGYSADVPPDTTVYIYTTNGGLPEDHALAESLAANGRVVVQEVPSSGSQAIEPVSKTSNVKETFQYRSPNVTTSQISEVKNTHDTASTTIVSKFPIHSLGKSVPSESFSDHNKTDNGKELTFSQTSSDAQSSAKEQPSNSPAFIMSPSENVTKPSSPVNTLSRMVILNKTSSSDASPWAVGSDDDSSGADALFGTSVSVSAKSPSFSCYNRKPDSSEQHSLHTTDASSPQVTLTNPAATKPVASSVQISSQSVANSTVHPQTVSLLGAETLFKEKDNFSSKDTSDGKENTLNSIGVNFTNFVENSDLNLLSTMEISKFASIIGKDSLPNDSIPNLSSTPGPLKTDEKVIK